MLPFPLKFNLRKHPDGVWTVYSYRRRRWWQLWLPEVDIVVWWNAETWRECRNYIGIRLAAMSTPASRTRAIEAAKVRGR